MPASNVAICLHGDLLGDCCGGHSLIAHTLSGCLEAQSAAGGSDSHFFAAPRTASSVPPTAF
jgi:hypothetical protein